MARRFKLSDKARRNAARKTRRGSPVTIPRPIIHDHWVETRTSPGYSAGSRARKAAMAVTLMGGGYDTARGRAVVKSPNRPAFLGDVVHSTPLPARRGLGYSAGSRRAMVGAPLTKAQEAGLRGVLRDHGVSVGQRGRNRLRHAGGQSRVPGSASRTSWSVEPTWMHSQVHAHPHSIHDAHHHVMVGRRVPPPGRPHGRLGGPGGGVAYRYPGSRRAVSVGQGDLVDVGTTKCVPCKEVARMARG